jgi:AraC-like DNA-binding protein
MVPARPLDRFPIIRTRSVEEMRVALAQIYAKPELIPEGSARTLKAVLNQCALQHIKLGYAEYGAAARLQFPETNLVSLLIPHSGRGEVVVGGSSGPMTPERGAIISCNMGYQGNYAADYGLLALRIDSNALTKKLSALTGVPINRPLKFNLTPDFARPAAQSLRNLFLFLVGEVSKAATSLPPLMLAEMEQALMVAFLCGNQHNYSYLLEQPPPSVAPWQVRRAEDYIAANWDQPIRLEDIVTATGVSARSLFRTFRQNRGCSPMAFVKQVRLRHAQQLLQSAQTTTTVTRVAFACGFDDLGRFSKDYLRAFGELPSAALHRGKGAASSQH